MQKCILNRCNYYYIEITEFVYRSLLQYSLHGIIICLRFIYWKGRVMAWESRGERKVFHLLTHSPTGYKSQGWARPKHGAWSFLRVSHAGNRDPSTGATCAAFSVHLQEAGLEAEQQGPEPMLVLEVATGSLCHDTGPLWCFFILCVQPCCTWPVVLRGGGTVPSAWTSCLRQG